MSEKMLKFINVNQQNPKKRETANRIEVSLKDETTAIGKYKHAHTTIA